VNRPLLALYPRGWRDRYGAEVADLANELIAAGETTRLRAAADLLGGAAAERWRVATSRAVLVPTAAGAAAAGGIALAVSHTLHGAAATRPYFDGHTAGLLLPVLELGWILMELAEFVRGRRSRPWRERAAPGAPAAPVRQRGYPVAIGVCVFVASLMMYLAPAAVPAAAIRPGGAAFAVGVAAVVAGLGLRGWSFRALRGRYFNFAIAVSPDQAVVTSGPYRLLRHPGCAGFLLACTGLGLTSANWLSLAANTLLPLTMLIWRIRTEENALLAVLGERYGRYASGHRRLIPLIW
jgi:protein-S-isoprenylcysteine O-methyltransferase Ste14